MELVEVDVVGLQPAQARVERPADVERGELAGVGPVVHVAVELGRDDRPLAPAAALGEPVADDGFRGALARRSAVDVGGVEEIDALLVGRSMIENESGSLVSQPKFMVPRQIRLTERPLRPRWVNFMP